MGEGCSLQPAHAAANNNIRPRSTRDNGVSAAKKGRGGDGRGRERRKKKKKKNVV